MKTRYAYKEPEAMEAPEYSSFDSALDEITRLVEKERIVFVIDEYPLKAAAEKEDVISLDNMY